MYYMRGVKPANGLAPAPYGGRIRRRKGGRRHGKGIKDVARKAWHGTKKAWHGIKKIWRSDTGKKLRAAAVEHLIKPKLNAALDKHIKNPGMRAAVKEVANRGTSHLAGEGVRRRRSHRKHGGGSSPFSGAKWLGKGMRKRLVRIKGHRRGLPHRVARHRGKGMILNSSNRPVLY